MAVSKLKPKLSEAEKILSELKEDWQKHALAMYMDGCSDREVMRDLNLTPAKWRILERDVLASDFSDIVEFGRMLSAAWWEEQGRVNLTNKTFNTGLWLANVKHRLGWGEGNAVEALEMQSIDSEDLARQINALLPKFQDGVDKTTL